MKFLLIFLSILVSILGVIIFSSNNPLSVYAAIQVDICHATGSGSNPYIQNHVSINSTADCANANGHDSHINDIIPIFTFDGCTYPGKNWTVQNQAIWNNSCNLLPTPTPTFSPTPTPTSTPGLTPSPTSAPTPTPTPAPNCGNGICQASLGETCSICSADCGSCLAPTPTPTTIPGATPTLTPTPSLCGGNVCTGACILGICIGGTTSTITNNTSGTSTPVSIPSEKPKVICSDFAENPTANENVAFTGSATSKHSTISRIEVSIDNGLSWGPAIFSNPDFSLDLGKLQDGNYSVLARAFDTLGDVGECKPITLVIDRIKPIIGGNISAFGPEILYPVADGTISSVAGVKTTFVISMRGGVTTAVIKTDEREFPLRHLAGTDLWEGEVWLTKKSASQLTVIAKDGAGHTAERTINFYSAQDYGNVTSASTREPVKDAKVTLYIFDEVTKSWVVWDSASYGQNNPQTTTSEGQYSFLVPNGKYYLEVKKAGYQTALSEITQISENTVLNTPVTLIPYSQLGISLGYLLPSTYKMQIGKPATALSQDSMKIGAEMPSFSFDQTNGVKFTQKNIKTKKYVLIFFSPWSALSIEGISQASQKSQESASQAEIIGVDVQESPFATDTFLKRGKYDFFAVSDYNGQYSSDVGVTTLPYYVFVDSDGKISDIFVGVLTKEELLKRIAGMP